jgi:hypothetical protein
MKTGARMHHQILNALKKLNEDLACLVLCQFVLHYNPVEEFTLSRKLKNKIDPVFLVKGIFEAKHLRVAHSHKDGDLLLQSVGLDVSFSPGRFSNLFTAYR